MSYISLALFFFYSPGDLREQHSFPTRRSSDLMEHAEKLGVASSLMFQPVEPRDDITKEVPKDLNPFTEHYYQLSSRSEEHTSELQSRGHLVCRLLLEKKKMDLYIKV